MVVDRKPVVRALKFALGLGCANRNEINTLIRLLKCPDNKPLPRQIHENYTDLNKFALLLDCALAYSPAWSSVGMLEDLGYSVPAAIKVRIERKSAKRLSSNVQRLVSMVGDNGFDLIADKHSGQLTLAVFVVLGRYCFVQAPDTFAIFHLIEDFIELGNIKAAQAVMKDICNLISSRQRVQLFGEGVTL